MKCKKLTLIELIIVILVLGLLVGLAIPQFTGVKSNAEVSRLKNDIDVLSSAITERYVKEDTLPLGNAVILPEGDLKDYILARGDDTTKLFKIDLSITEKYHNKLKSKVDADNYFIYSTKTGNVYHSTGRENGDDKVVFGIKEFPFITLMGGKPLSSESINVSEVTSITLSGEMNPGDAVSVMLNDVTQTVSTGNIPLIKNLQATSNTYSVNLTLLDDTINKVIVKVGKTAETYKILVGEVPDEEIVENIDDKLKVSMGATHTIILKEDGTLWGLGNNYYGQLGSTINNNKSNANFVPIKIEIEGKIKDISAGNLYTLILMDDGTVKSFGLNNAGQLGIPNNVKTINPNPVPTTITGLINVKKIVAGYTHALALLNDGSVKVFGSNYYGELGNSVGLKTSNAYWSPVTIPNLGIASDIAAGANHSLVVLEDGTVKGFGYNRQGQLGSVAGNNTENANFTPTSINGISNASKVYACYLSSAVLLNNGDVVTFGQNNYGQLGRPGTTYSASTAPLTSIKDVKEIAIGYSHILYLKNSGELVGTGLNHYGSIGTYNFNSLLPNNSPLLITDGVTAISANGNSTLVIKDNKVFGYGSNVSGELGSSVLNNKSTPVEIIIQ